MTAQELDITGRSTPIGGAMRIQRWTTLAFLLLIAWCTMCTTHELGHLLGGWLSGAKLQSWSIAPWSIPFSLHDPDPRPLVTLWSGPLLGVFLPTFVASLLRQHWIWFVAHFCTLANGSYLAIAWFTDDRYLDTRRLLEAGTPPWILLVFCVLTIAVGYSRFRGTCISLLSAQDLIMQSAQDDEDESEQR